MVTANRLVGCVSRGRPSLASLLLSRHYIANSAWCCRPIVTSACCADTTAGNGHMSLTAHSSRHQLVCAATVAAVSRLSHNVRGVTLHVPDPAFSFRAGQWVDLMIPGTDMVGGYSVCSAPNRLHQLRLIDLAVKLSSWPPAQWIHNQCTVGTQVHVRTGGDFYWSPEESVSDPSTTTPVTTPAAPLPAAVPPLLLVAGGVGINPLLAILRHRHWLCRHQTRHQQQQQQQDTVTPVSRAVLLYTARTVDDLLFTDELSALSANGDVCVHCFVTRQTAPLPPTTALYTVTAGRLHCTNVASALSWLNHSEHNQQQQLSSECADVSCFVCGPVSLIDQTVDWLQHQLHLPAHCVHYERWT